MSGPFRELFVELPPDVFDGLRLKPSLRFDDALERPPSPPDPHPWWATDSVLRHLARGWLGWEELRVVRFDRFYQQADLIGTLACGHAVEFRVSSMEIRRGNGPSGVLDAADRAERKCTCMAPRDR